MASGGDQTKCDSGLPGFGAKRGGGGRLRFGRTGNDADCRSRLGQTLAVRSVDDPPRCMHVRNDVYLERQHVQNKQLSRCCSQTVRSGTQNSTPNARVDVSGQQLRDRSRSLADYIRPTARLQCRPVISFLAPISRACDRQRVQIVARGRTFDGRNPREV